MDLVQQLLESNDIIDFQDNSQNLNDFKSFHLHDSGKQIKLENFFDYYNENLTYIMKQQKDDEPLQNQIQQPTINKQFQQNEFKRNFEDAQSITNNNYDRQNSFKNSESPKSTVSFNFRNPKSQQAPLKINERKQQKIDSYKNQQTNESEKTPQWGIENPISKRTHTTTNQQNEPVDREDDFQDLIQIQPRDSTLEVEPEQPQPTIKRKDFRIRPNPIKIKKFSKEKIKPLRKGRRKPKWVVKSKNRIKSGYKKKHRRIKKFQKTTKSDQQFVKRSNFWVSHDNVKVKKQLIKRQHKLGNEKLPKIKNTKFHKNNQKRKVKIRSNKKGKYNILNEIYKSPFYDNQSRGTLPWDDEVQQVMFLQQMFQQIQQIQQTNPGFKLPILNTTKNSSFQYGNQQQTNVAQLPLYQSNFYNKMQNLAMLNQMTQSQPIGQNFMYQLS